MVHLHDKKSPAMKYIYSVLLLALTLFVKANHTPTVFNKLNGINACWSEQTDIRPLPIYGAAVKTYSDQQLIQLHLQLVETILRNRNTDGLSEAQKIARNNNLDHLRQYWQINTYPINNKTVKRNPVFIDDYNTFCAVGYLIKTSGHEPLARKIAATNNLAYLRDMRITELNQWVNNCGLTLDELAWIQPGYMAQNTSRSLGKGVNGPVYALIGDSLGKKIYAAGNFTEADGSINCNHIVEINYDEYDIFNNTFNAMGDGLNGKVYALCKDGNDIYAGGHFDHSGTIAVSNIAKWNGTNWQGLGELNGSIYCITKYNNQLYAGGVFDFTFNGQTHHNIAYWDGSNWKPVCMINDTVKALTVYKNRLIVGGAFTSVDAAPINHVFAYDGISITSLEYGVTATVRALESTGGRLYAGGDLKTNATDTNYFGIKWYDDSWGWEGDYVNDIYHGTQGGKYITHVNTISNHYVGGKLVGGGMYVSYNTAYYNDIDVKNNYLTSFASINFDGEIFTILSLGKKVFFGGEFSTILSGIQGGSDWSHPANNLAVWDPGFVGLNDISSNKHFKLSPNPTAGTTLIGSTSSIKNIHVYDINGKLIWANTPEKGITEFSLERVIFPSTGLYLVMLQTSNGEIQNQKLLVE